MANRLTMATISAIDTLRNAGRSRRQVAELLGIHRETVGKYFDRLQNQPDHPAGGARNTEPMIVEAARIVDQSFASLTSIGMLRLRESPYARPELDLEGFISALSELFPVP